MAKNIILTGMPGAGKSTVGVVLAKNLGMDFIDLDILISKRRGCILQSIIDTRGLDEFLKIEEHEALRLGTESAVENAVIATGGSVVLSEAAILHLLKMGINIYLDVELEELTRRLVNIKTRGIAARPGERVEDIFMARQPYYEKYADITIDCRDKSTEDIVAEISDMYSKRRLPIVISQKSDKII